MSLPKKNRPSDPPRPMILLCAGDRDESNFYGNRIRNETGDYRPFFHLEDVRELPNVPSADLVYVGSYMARPDITALIEGIDRDQKAGRLDVHLMPLNGDIERYEPAAAPDPAPAMA